MGLIQTSLTRRDDFKFRRVATNELRQAFQGLLPIPK